MNFKIGDVVRLKSGGPDMTVDSINGVDVRCIWMFPESTNILGAWFCEKTLDLINDGDGFYDAELENTEEQPYREWKYSLD